MLVLSCFAGAADAMDGALVVNPHDVESTSEALRRALDMDLEERQERWRRMISGLEAWTVHDWAEQYLAALGRGQDRRGGDIGRRVMAIR